MRKARPVFLETQICFWMKIQVCCFKIRICVSKNTGLGFLKIHPCILKYTPVFSKYTPVFSRNTRYNRKFFLNNFLYKFTEKIKIHLCILSLILYFENTPLYFENTPLYFQNTPLYFSKIHPCIFENTPLYFQNTPLYFKIQGCI